jgi:hypothetical protein
MDARAQVLTIAAAAALMAPGAAWATAYSVLDSTPDAVTVVDPASAQTLGQTAVRQAWSITVKRVLTTGGPQQPGYVLTLNEYNCLSHQLRWRSFKAYSRFGDLVMKQDNPDPAWTPAPATGEGAYAMKAVCEGAGARSVISANSVSQLVLTLMQAWDSQAPLPPAQVPSDPPKKKPAAKARKVRS